MKSRSVTLIAFVIASAAGCLNTMPLTQTQNPEMGAVIRSNFVPILDKAFSALYQSNDCSKILSEKKDVEQILQTYSNTGSRNDYCVQIVNTFYSNRENQSWSPYTTVEFRNCVSAVDFEVSRRAAGLRQKSDACEQIRIQDERKISEQKQKLEQQKRNQREMERQKQETARLAAYREALAKNNAAYAGRDISISWACSSDVYSAGMMVNGGRNVGISAAMAFASTGGQSRGYSCSRFPSRIATIESVETIDGGNVIVKIRGASLWTAIER